jgi:hypothetical protein
MTLAGCATTSNAEPPLEIPPPFFASIEVQTCLLTCPGPVGQVTAIMESNGTRTFKTSSDNSTVTFTANQTGLHQFYVVTNENYTNEGVIELLILDDFQGAKIHLLVYPAEIQQTKVFTFTGPTIGDQNLLFQELIFNEDPGFHAAMQNRIRNAGAVITWENSLESNADFVPCIGTTKNPRILESESNERSPLPSSERHVKSWTVSEMGHVMNQVSATHRLSDAHTQKTIYS